MRSSEVPVDTSRSRVVDITGHLEAFVGGGSDGNFTGAMGVPTLDGLGVAGAGAHTLDEHIMVDSLAYRGRLMAGVLAALD